MKREIRNKFELNKEILEMISLNKEIHISRLLGKCGISWVRGKIYLNEFIKKGYIKEHIKDHKTYFYRYYSITEKGREYLSKLSLFLKEIIEK